MLRLLTAVVAISQIGAGSPPPAELRGEALMDALRSGGYTLLVRHARTDRSIPNQERPDYSPPLRADQRNLTPEGEADVRRMAAVVRKFGLPIGEVVSSPMYRCRETADAFGPHSTTLALRTFPTTAETAAILSAAPRPGTNRVLVTHHFVIEAHVAGIRPGDIGESEVAVVRPDGKGGVTLVGRITLGDWTTLAGDAPTPTRALRLERLAHRYVEAFNSGDPATMGAYIESSLSPDARRTTRERVEAFTRIFAQLGRLEVMEVAPAAEDAVELRVRAKVGEVRVRVVAEPEPSERLRSVTFLLPGGGDGP